MGGLYLFIFSKPPYALPQVWCGFYLLWDQSQCDWFWPEHLPDAIHLRLH